MSPPIKLSYSVGFKTSSGKTDNVMHRTHLFDNFNDESSVYPIFKYELLKRKSQQLPPNELTIVCTLKLPSDMKDETTDKLCLDLRRMMLSGDNSDMTVKVKGKDFKLHKNILSARSPYFCTMFEIGMREKNTGIIRINDCDPDIFSLFICFLYTGEVDKISVKNVCRLFKLADKYLQEELKKECLKFMMYSISVDTFLDYIVLAFRYGEKNLQKYTEEFFSYYGRKIKRSPKWQMFVNEYPEIGRKLSIKYPTDSYTDTSEESDDN